MGITIRQNDRYFIKGKIVETASNGTLVIFAAQPFSCEIKFTCFPIQYNCIHSSRLSKYNWLGVSGGSHPGTWEAAAYYNTAGYFYKKESASESDGNPEWKTADFEDILYDNSHLRTNDSHSYQKEHKFFEDRYIPILEKGMLCSFYAYALEEVDEGNLKSVHSKQVERHPNDYDDRWIYDPDSFRIEEWNAESIEGLVREILPSRECVEDLRKRHRAIDKESRRKQWRELCESIKSIPKRIENHLQEYSRLSWFIINLGILLITIASLAYTILKGQNPMDNNLP